jgi:omega-6 fatty acid desaturase (delta-12 desaturase)
MNTSEKNNINTDRTWEKVIMKYNRPQIVKSIWQICNTLIPYLLVMVLIYKSFEYPYWVTIILYLLAAGLLIRSFILFHDCGHGSFFSSRRANNIIGSLIGILVFTPYAYWSYNHKVHHATSGNLDKRGTGDVWTLTVDEYSKLSIFGRFKYKLYRNPFVLFVLGAIYVSLIKNRLTNKGMTKENRLNVYFTNAGIIILASVASLIIGVKAYLLIQLPVIVIAYALGHWLFYVQHQFSDVYWERTPDWDYKTAAITGSSFLKLPGIMRWFTGNIGYHHIHHLSSKIPNYNLRRCFKENDLFKQAKPLTFLTSFRTFKLRLWDETAKRMVSFREFRLLQQI